MIRKQSPLAALGRGLGAIALASLPALALAVEGMDIDFHGYARSGIGRSVKGGDQVCFQAAGAPAKYRLGNECETFSDIQLGAQLAEENGSIFRLDTTVAYNTRQAKDWENLSGDGDEIALREMNVKARNVFPALPGAQLWAGKRYYQRHDVHMSDWYYWNTSGPGAGLEDIPMDFGKLHIAWVRNEVTVASELPSSSEVTTDIIDIRLNNLMLTKNLSLELGLDYGKGSAGDNLLNKDFFDQDGFMGTAELAASNFLGGYNKFVLQYATDAMTGPGVGHSGLTSQPSKWFTGSKMKRILDHGHIVITDRLEMMYVIAFTQLDYGDDAQNFQAMPKELKWFTAGIRPIWKWSELTSTAIELGWDKVENGISFIQSGEQMFGDSQLVKFTIAQQFHPSFGAFVRPAIRVFATYAKWDEAECLTEKDCHSLSGDSDEISNTFGSDTSGWTFGVQFEAWW